MKGLVNGSDPVCPICTSTSKMETGECSECGVYSCLRCGKLHFGEPDFSDCTSVEAEVGPDFVEKMPVVRA